MASETTCHCTRGNGESWLKLRRGGEIRDSEMVQGCICDIGITHVTDCLPHCTLLRPPPAVLSSSSPPLLWPRPSSTSKALSPDYSQPFTPVVKFCSLNICISADCKDQFNFMGVISFKKSLSEQRPIESPIKHIFLR